MTDVDLPQGWAMAQVGALGDFINGMAFKPTDWGETGTPIIRIQNLTDPDRPINLTEREVDEKYVVEHGDILVSWSATLDAFKWHGSRAYVNQHIFKVVPNSELDPGFVFYALKKSIKELISSEHLHGSTMKHINRRPFLAHPCALPPLNEQQRIVEKIETLFAELDKGEESLRQGQTLLARYRQSVLKAAVTESGGSSEKVQLGELLQDIRYGTAKKCRAEVEGVPVLRIPNVVTGQIDLEDLKFAELDEKEMSRLRLTRGDVLLVRSNGSVNLVGRTAVVDDRAAGMAFAGYLIRLRADQDWLLPDFLHVVLNSPEVRAKIERQARSTSGVHNINSTEVKAIELDLPSLAKQSEIVAQVGEQVANAQLLEAACTAELSRSSALRQSILKEAFSGRLVPQDPHDEPASELLARIHRSQEAGRAAKR